MNGPISEKEIREHFLSTLQKWRLIIFIFFCCHLWVAKNPHFCYTKRPRWSAIFSSVFSWDSGGMLGSEPGVEETPTKKPPNNLMPLAVEILKKGRNSYKSAIIFYTWCFLSSFTQIVTVRNPELWGRMHCAQCIDRTPMSEGDSSWVGKTHGSSAERRHGPHGPIRRHDSQRIGKHPIHL